MSKHLIYLASPYSHKDIHVMALRELQITTIAVKLIEEGFHIFGPITESAQYSKLSKKIGKGWKFWKEHDEMMLARCDELWVVTMEGWKESKGVQGEIRYATEHGIPVSYIDPKKYLGG